MPRRLHIYGLVAEFDGPDSLIAAAERATAEGYRRKDAYSPYPVHGLSEALGLRRSKVPMIVLIGGIIGALTGAMRNNFNRANGVAVAPKVHFVVLALAFALLAPGCRKQDMAEQPRFEPMEPSNFFSNGQSARPLVEGTVPRGKAPVHDS